MKRNAESLVTVHTHAFANVQTLVVFLYPTINKK